MEQYVGLDVSLKEISVCIIDSKGAVVFEGKTATEPATLVDLIRGMAPQVARVGLETGSTSPWLFHALTSAGLPVVCMDARHAHAALSIGPRSQTAAMPGAWPTCCVWAGIARCMLRASPRTSTGRCLAPVINS